MRKPWAVLVLAVFPTLLPGLAHACGDKLVVLGRGVRFERILRAENPGAVLVYLNPESKLHRAEEEFRLTGSLELAGHEVIEVASRTELENALRVGGTEAIVADLADARQLWNELAGEDQAPRVIPVLYKPTREELAQVEQLTQCFGQAAKRRTRTLLAVIDEVIGQRRRGDADSCAPSVGKAKL